MPSWLDLVTWFADSGNDHDLCTWCGVESRRGPYTLDGQPDNSTAHLNVKCLWGRHGPAMASLELEVLGTNGSTLKQRLRMDASPGSRGPGSSEEVECLAGKYAGDNQKGQCTVCFHDGAPAVRAVQFQANRKEKER